MVPQVPWWFLDSWNRHLPRYITPNVDTKLFRFTGWGEKKNNGCIRTRVSLFWRVWNMGKKESTPAGLASCFLKPKVFSFKGRLVARWSKRLEKITSNLFLRLLLFCELKPCVTKHPKNSITFQAVLDLHRQACLNTSSRTRSNFKLTWVTCCFLLVLALTMILLDSFFSLFVLYLQKARQPSMLHASVGFWVFSAVPLSLCHVKATLYTVNRWSQACLQNWKPPVSPNFGATYPFNPGTAVRDLCVTHKVFQFAMALRWLGCPVEPSSSASATSTAKATVRGMKMASIL